MSTRSLIALERDDNMVEYIYCHWDGYPEYVGKILKTNYNSKEKIESLLKMGNISSLADTIEKTEFYIRDFGEEVDDNESIEEEKEIYLSGESVMGSEYHYLFTKDNELLCYCVNAGAFIDMSKSVG